MSAILKSSKTILLIPFTFTILSCTPRIQKSELDYVVEYMEKLGTVEDNTITWYMPYTKVAYYEPDLIYVIYHKDTGYFGIGGINKQIYNLAVEIYGSEVLFKWNEFNNAVYYGLIIYQPGEGSGSIYPAGQCELEFYDITLGKCPSLTCSNMRIENSTTNKYKNGENKDPTRLSESFKIIEIALDNAEYHFSNMAEHGDYDIHLW